MKVFQLNKPLMIVTLLAASMNAMAFDVEEIEENQSPFVHDFKTTDVNENGIITWYEMPKDKTINYETFVDADQNGDKALNESEYVALRTETSKEKVEQVASDSAITAKAKAKLLAEKNLKSLKISVETYKGEVILSGFVNDQETKAKAEQLVTSIEGVKSVKNGLVIKS